jgi:hypothetical protein|tara:strand:+ start:128 stop:667 length:540 start_codon:yes stop_codon:yes gene_type:complete
MDKRNPSQPEQEPGVPAKLVADLKGLHKEHIFVPPKVDESILDAAREHLGDTSGKSAEQEPMRQPWILQWAPWASAAACLMLILFLTFPGGKQNSSLTSDAAPRQPFPSPAIVATKISPKDINRDGQVDILDAFALANRLEDGEAHQDQWDMNGDGQVDQADVDEISAVAVKLETGDKS